MGRGGAEKGGILQCLEHDANILTENMIDILC